MRCGRLLHGSFIASIPNVLLARSRHRKLPHRGHRNQSGINLRASVAPNEPMSTFEGNSSSDLGRWLEKFGVPTAHFGKGACKSLEDLLTEVKKGETTLTVVNGNVKRRIEVLNLYISAPGQDKVLMEEQQVLPSGIARNRGLPLAEKLLPREEWKDCLVRALHEELGSILEPNKLSYCCNASEYRRSEETWVSASYPGLETTSIHHRVPVEVKGLPQTDFWTFEKRPGGLLRTHWVWADQSAFPRPPKWS